MRRVLFTLCLSAACLFTMAEVKYVFNQINSPTGGSTLSTGGATISAASGEYTFASGKNGAIKFSKKTYTVKLPTTANITKIEFYGYSNYDTADGYISNLAGTSYESDEYFFPAKSSDGTLNWQTSTINFSTPLTGSFNFTVAGNQSGLIITMYSNETETQEMKDQNSLGKYSNPATGGVVPTGASTTFSYPTSTKMMEKLDRGVIVLPEMNGKGNVITWRWLGTDGLGKASKTTFDVLKNGTVIKSGLSTVTNYTDATGTKTDKYVVVTKVDGVETERSSAVLPWNRIYKSLKLDRPAADATTGAEYTPNDMSCADLDGDGQYEIVVKWNPTNSRDNSQSGVTGLVFLDAYKFNLTYGDSTATRLWRIQLGKNIRAGAHYTQFLVYDFDQDGKAELICKTAPGTLDGTGKYVNKASADLNISAVSNIKNCRNSSGYVNSGEEFLTVFNGETGAAMQTIWYNPSRALALFPTSAGSYSGSWGDSYGGRGDRYNAAVAYLDGANGKPYAIMQRGYYTQAFFWAVEWDGTNLSTKWLHYGNTSSSWKTYDGSGKQIFSGSGKSSYGQGVHGISIGDVNNDGYDEIVMGSATIAHDGQLLCSTGLGHGDAIHLSDLCPDRPGLEVMMPHEESPYGFDVHDATTGERIYYAKSDGDNGRGLSADILASNRGFEFWSSAESVVRSCVDGSQVGSKVPSKNFRVYWDGDLQDELFDGHHSTTQTDALLQTDINGTCAAAIEKPTSSSNVTLLSLSQESYGNGKTCNITKGTPCLQADLFGDWREELILWDGNDPSIINIYSSNVPSTYAVPTLMHDHVYRMGIAWQNSSYNQPPHLGYYLPDMFDKNYGIYSEGYGAYDVADVNHDKKVDSADVKYVVDVICAGTDTYNSADANNDKSINVLDVNYIIKVIGDAE